MTENVPFICTSNMTNKNLFTIIFYEQVLNNILNDVSNIILVLAILTGYIYKCCYAVVLFTVLIQTTLNCQEISWQLYLISKVLSELDIYLQNI